MVFHSATFCFRGSDLDAFLFMHKAWSLQKATPLKMIWEK